METLVGNKQFGKCKIPGVARGYPHLFLELFILRGFESDDLPVRILLDSGGDFFIAANSEDTDVRQTCGR
jgi:hypothetical protein